MQSLIFGGVSWWRGAVFPWFELCWVWAVPCCLSHDGSLLPARNVSSERSEARRKLRECDGLVDALIYVVQSEIGQKDSDSKVPQQRCCEGTCRALPLSTSSSRALLFMVAEAGFIPRQMKNGWGQFHPGRGGFGLTGLSWENPVQAHAFPWSLLGKR